MHSGRNQNPSQNQSHNPNLNQNQYSEYSSLTLDSIQNKMKQQFERIEKISGSSSSKNVNVNKPAYVNNFVEGSFAKNSQNHSRNNSNHKDHVSYQSNRNNQSGGCFVLDG